MELDGSELRKAQKSDRTGDRAFYMNLAMNGFTKQDYEFAGMTNDRFLMKRSLAK